ncbi:hypothetical protein D3870_06920 [Noviherbaspirillum cavernae]|uniref:Uncharacterized protein n=1 Tax=Noviherbaspirillum cavernae TaxID=2320862 RepID=A0A418WZU8_9BURK|nr:hypothetical protein D3870_06920 [Noviherbaspirillum cavernae]
MQHGTGDVCEVGVLEEGIALVCGKAKQTRFLRNGARMRLIAMPSTRLSRAERLEYVERKWRHRRR